MLGLNGNIESKGAPAAAYSYKVTARRTGIWTASCKVELTLEMTDPDEWYRYRVKSSVRVNGVLQEAWVKDDLREWWGGAKLGPFEVFSGEVPVDYDARKLDIVPCIWHPYSQGGYNDSCNWEGETGVWHPFVNDNEDVPGAYDDVPAPFDGGFLNNRAYDKLDAGPLIDAFDGVQPVRYVWREWSEWPASLAGSIRMRVWWETAPLADSYRLWCKVNGSPKTFIGTTRDTTWGFVASDIPQGLSAGDSLMFGVQSASGGRWGEDVVWSEPVSIASPGIDGSAADCSMSPTALDIDKMPDSQRVVVEWGYSGTDAYTDSITDIVSVDGSDVGVRIASDAYGTRISTQSVGHGYDFDVSFSVNGKPVRTTRVLRDPSGRYRLSVALSALLSAAGISKYEARAVQAGVDTWRTLDGARAGKLSSVLAGTLMLSRNSGRAPDGFRLVSTTNRGRVNDVYVEGEDVILTYWDVVEGTVAIDRMELVSPDTGDAVSSWRHGDLTPTAGGSYNVHASLPAFERAGTFVEFELRCWDAQGGPVYGRSGSWPRSRVHVFDGTVYAWREEAGQDGEWRKSPTYVWDGAKWNLAFEVYACCEDGKLRRR